MTFDQVVAACLAQFDTDSTTAARWVNARLARMVAEAEWLMATPTVGTTVAGTANYSITSDLVDLRRIQITGTDGTVAIYEATSIDDLWNADAAANTSGSRLFAENWTPTGGLQIRVYPTPDVSGLAIVGQQALQASTLTYGSGSALPIPVDFHDALLDGAFADGYLQMDERPDLAQFHEERYQRGVDRLKARRNARVGPAEQRVQVSGYDFGV